MKKNNPTIFHVIACFILISSIIPSCGIAQTSGTPMEAEYKIAFGLLYRLNIVGNGKAVEVEDGLLSKGVKVQQYEGYSRNGSADGHGQEWVFLPGGSIERDGQTIYLVRILNYGFLNYLTNESGVPKLTKPQAGVANLGQFWEVVPTPQRDVIKLRSHVGNLYLQAPNNSNNSESMTLAANTNSTFQQFTTVRLSYGGVPTELFNTPVVIKPTNNLGLALDVTACSTAQNTLLNAWTAGVNNTCQQFIISAGGASNFNKISPVLNQNLKVRLQEIGSKSPGANIVIGGEPTPYSTLWLPIHLVRDQGKYIFINLMSGLCMEVWNARTDKGATIGQNIFSNESHQKWTITRAN